MPRRRSHRSGQPVARVDDLLYPSLDLHGESAESARSRATLWLRERREEGERTVRLITGRGRHSIGPPVLPAEIEALLEELKGSEVARFEREPGGGAYRVELRGRDPVEKRRTITPPPAPPADDPVLRLRAEEALAELGITPTPELLRAEMRRLRSAAE